MTGSVVAALGFVATAAAAGPLTVESYLAQVREGNEALLASRATQESLTLKSEEAGMAFSPLFSAGYTWYDGRAKPLTPFDPAETEARTWNLSLAKKWFTGTTLSADYGLAYTHLFPQAFTLPPGPLSSLLGGFESALVPAAPYWEAKPSLTVSQSLLRDFMAGLTDSGVRKVATLAEAGAMAERYRAAAVLFDAESAYWSLALARAVLAFKRESLERTTALRDWTARRVAQNLADDADLLQADAAVQLRALDVELGREDVDAAARRVNTARGRDGTDVAEDLDDVGGRAAAVGAGPAPDGTERLDVAASRLALEAARLAARETRYRALPDLQVFGTVAVMGRDDGAGSANHDASTGDWPTYTVGAVFTAPLDLPRLARVRRGYDRDLEAAERGYRQAALQASQDWAALRRRWEDSAGRLALARTVAGIQDGRVQAEHQRYDRGRITTFQLLTAEEDFEQARLAVLRLGFERILLDAQARWYGAR